MDPRGEVGTTTTAATRRVASARWAAFAFAVYLAVAFALLLLHYGGFDGRGAGDGNRTRITSLEGRPDCYNVRHTDTLSRVSFGG